MPADQVAPLREGITTFLLGSQQTVLTPDAAVATFERARDFEKRLPEPSRTYLHYVNERDTKKLGAILLPYLNQLGADDPALSPDRITTIPTAPVYLLHGIDDTVIPAVESALLAESLRSPRRRRPPAAQRSDHARRGQQGRPDRRSGRS